MDIRGEIAAERRELADMLAGLTPEEWDAPSLCAGWRVRDVVAHTTMAYRYSVPRFMFELLRSGVAFNRMSDRCARRDAGAMTSEELGATLRDNAEHPWKPPRGGYEGALTHDVVHGLDITVALGLDRRVQERRLRPVIDGLASASGLRYFGVDVTGVELRADDLDWSFGSGTPLTGAAQHLGMVLCGRRLPPGLLRGETAARFTAEPGTGVAV